MFSAMERLHKYFQGEMEYGMYVQLQFKLKLDSVKLKVIGFYQSTILRVYQAADSQEA